MRRFWADNTLYEDANDHQALRFDPGLKTAVGRLPETGPALASQPTLSRFENRVGNCELRRLSEALMDAYVAAHPAPRKVIVLDMDATDDPVHGMQQLCFFHGYYDQYMLHPLLIFDGLTGFPAAAVLRPVPIPISACLQPYYKTFGKCRSDADGTPLEPTLLTMKTESDTTGAPEIGVSGTKYELITETKDSGPIPRASQPAVLPKNPCS